MTKVNGHTPSYCGPLFGVEPAHEYNEHEVQKDNGRQGTYLVRTYLFRPFVRRKHGIEISDRRLDYGTAFEAAYKMSLVAKAA